MSGSGSLVKKYTAGGLNLGENTATSASGVSYLASDGLGSVSEALNQTGSATGSILYGSYGSVRYYDPSLGQFTIWDLSSPLPQPRASLVLFTLASFCRILFRSNP